MEGLGTLGEGLGLMGGHWERDLGGLGKLGEGLGSWEEDLRGVKGLGALRERLGVIGGDWEREWEDWEH